MLLKYLLVGIIFYFIVKTSGNLMQAIRGGLDEARRDPRFDSRSSRSDASSTWQTGSTNRSSTRSSERWDQDIEDAQWEDLS